MSEESSPNEPNIITAAAAAAAALATVSDGGQNVEVSLVARLDGGNSYYLVAAEGAHHTGTIAAIDAVNSSVMASARMKTSAKSFLISESRARLLANLPASSKARLVWKASRASLSPLYPLWEITDGVSNVYVNQSSTIWHELLPGGPG